MRSAGLQWDADCSDSAEVLGAVLGIDAAAIARQLHEKLGGANGLFGPFFRRVQSGGFSVQAAMAVAGTHSRPPGVSAALPATSRAGSRSERMGRPDAAGPLQLCSTWQPTRSDDQPLRRRCGVRVGWGGFGLASATLISPLAFLASVAQSAAQPGGHPLSADTLPTTSLLHQWLHAALTCPTVDELLTRNAVKQLHPTADTFTGHYHRQPEQAATLQSKLSTAASNSLFPRS